MPVIKKHRDGRRNLLFMDLINITITPNGAMTDATKASGKLRHIIGINRRCISTTDESSPYGMLHSECER
jgi:hypothetical protein